MGDHHEASDRGRDRTTRRWDEPPPSREHQSHQRQQSASPHHRESQHIHDPRGDYFRARSHSREQRFRSRRGSRERSRDHERSERDRYRETAIDYIRVRENPFLSRGSRFIGSHDSQYLRGEPWERPSQRWPSRGRSVERTRRRYDSRERSPVRDRRRRTREGSCDSVLGDGSGPRRRSTPPFSPPRSRESYRDLGASRHWSHSLQEIRDRPHRPQSRVFERPSLFPPPVSMSSSRLESFSQSSIQPAASIGDHYPSLAFLTFPEFRWGGSARRPSRSPRRRSPFRRSPSPRTRARSRSRSPRRTSRSPSPRRSRSPRRRSPIGRSPPRRNALFSPPNNPFILRQRSSSSSNSSSYDYTEPAFQVLRDQPVFADHAVITPDHIDPSDIVTSTISFLSELTDQQRHSGNFRIKYESKLTGAEVGTDIGGLFRDWLANVVKELLGGESKHSLIEESETSASSDGIHYIWPAHHEEIQDEPTQDRLVLFGYLLGLSLVQKIPLGIYLAPHFCKLLKGETPTFEDLSIVNPAIYSFLKNGVSAEKEKGDVLEPLESNAPKDFHDLRFTLSVIEAPLVHESSKDVPVTLSDSLDDRVFPIELGSDLQVDHAAPSSSTLAPSLEAQEPLPRLLKRRDSELCEQGEHLPLTSSNFYAYKQLVIYKNLMANPSVALSWIKIGMSNLDHVLYNLQKQSWSEIQEAIAGVAEINMEDWRANHRVTPSSKKGCDLIEWFFQYASSLTPQDRSDLFFWMNGYRVLPVGGMKQARIFQVFNILEFWDTANLPVAHTCSYTVDIPCYPSLEHLTERFEFARKNAVGFHLA